MNKDFDITNKQMPYTTPEGFFDELEEHIWEEVKDGYLADKPNDNEMQCAPLGVSVSNKSSKLRLVLRSFILMTASVALVLIVNINLSKQSTVSINDVIKHSVNSAPMIKHICSMSIKKTYSLMSEE